MSNRTHIIIDLDSAKVLRSSLEDRKRTLKDMLIALDEREPSTVHEYVESQIQTVRNLLKQLDDIDEYYKR